ncbi:MAG TPA: triacylglycerol lipase [Oligoflexus sp.]|uniref:lipase family alpha/beta hydrolase n=1 Tax=Oligoflexus sp. TaxID=1971216 RepID=UPI002D340E1F|nr:triacylglycerol lipase [Oligoflexus sp.]HYX39058.1 triacylglycerol lipase [Oligoflexus sp.]
MTRFMLSLGLFCALFTAPGPKLFATAEYDDEEYIEEENREVDPDIADYSEAEDLRARARQTQYPIVLLHGFLGWDQVFYFDYFYKVRSTLNPQGHNIYSTAVNPVQTVAARARELAPQLDAIMQATGAPKVNIIAHSMGGLDARYLVAHMGFNRKVASITTIGTPHYGSPIPGLIFKFLGKGDNLLYKAFEYLVSGFLGKGQMKPTDLDVRASLYNLSPEFLEGSFNPATPDSPDVYYQSYAGVSSITGWGTGDRMDPLLAGFQIAFGFGKRNDGLVSERSAQWGRYRGVVSADHIDLIGQLFGSTSDRFRHLSFYQELTNELADLGY